ncbi:MAG TPA: DUF433 domain-containing protein [Planctomycetaceae bacterium]|nr:DUF433 domain-containing protein [Planctomycetaceae bacterium]
MSDRELLERIVSDPDVMTGKPVIRGTRLPVELLVKAMAHGATVDELLAEYNSLTEADIQACLLFAAESVSGTALLPLARDAV